MGTDFPCDISFPMKNPICGRLCTSVACWSLCTFFRKSDMCWPVFYFANNTVDGRLKILFSA